MPVRFHPLPLIVDKFIQILLGARNRARTERVRQAMTRRSQVDGARSRRHVSASARNSLRQSLGARRFLWSVHRRLSIVLGSSKLAIRWCEGSRTGYANQYSPVGRLNPTVRGVRLDNVWCSSTVNYITFIALNLYIIPCRCLATTFPLNRALHFEQPTHCSWSVWLAELHAHNA